MNRQKVFYNVNIQLLFLLYIYVLIKIILFKFGSIDISFLLQQLKWSLTHPSLISNQLHSGNLVPFNEISRTLHGLSTHGLVNLVGNVVIFIPYGILLGLLLRNITISILTAFILSLGLSLTLEGAQAILSIGRFDVDDLILNSAGGLMGFITFRASSATIKALQVVK